MPLASAVAIIGVMRLEPTEIRVALRTRGLELGNSAGEQHLQRFEKELGISLDKSLINNSTPSSMGLHRTITEASSFGGRWSE
jgi:hypothetical protein